MPPLLNDPTPIESAPAARQRFFVQERLAGTPAEAVGNRTALQAENTPDIPVDEPPAEPEARAIVPATPLSAAPTAVNAADLRRQRLMTFRLRQMDQATFQEVPPRASGPLAAASRDLDVADFVTTNRWTLLGPTVVREGQSGKQPAMSGRVRGIAIAPGGQRIYIASANGGVWRSEDQGASWLSLMDAFDLNPSLYRADSLACGAIALAPGRWAGQDVIFVGSGEPGVVPWFQGDSAYFGVGPIVSTDGGLNWVTEASEPSLAGRAFYALAIDPLWPQRVVAATIDGIYCREADAQGGYRWTLKLNGYFCSVVAGYRNNVTTFYAAAWYGGVWCSNDGATWTALGQGFPSPAPANSATGEAVPASVNVNVGRVGLAVQEENPDVLYALVANTNGHLHGLYRMDRADTAAPDNAAADQWHPVSDVPRTLFGPDLQQTGQGGYDLAICVDPNDVNRLYIGGSVVLSDGIQPTSSGGDWSGALYRCEIEVHPTRKSVRAYATYIGGALHGDLHVLRFAPGDNHQLWVGCDGGVFYSDNPLGDPLATTYAAGLFQPRNTGLSTLTMNYLAQHPTEEAVLFCGTQDNGGLRYTGDPVWLYSSGGDSGYFVINWLDPYRVLTTYTYNLIFRTNDGGRRYSYEPVHVLPATGEAAEFYAPLAGTPIDPLNPSTAERVAFGGDRIWLSDHFGGDGLQWNGATWSGEVDWRSLPTNQVDDDRLDGNTKALVFANARLLYAGTTQGTLYRFDEVMPAAAEDQPGDSRQWRRTRLPAVATETMHAKAGPITSIALDPADPAGNALYITLGGIDNPQRVWYFDGTAWQPRSGSHADQANTTLSLLNVQYNAVVVDPQNPNHLYAAADIGVWRSVDQGQSWQVFSRGLPDAAVVDLKLHAPSRLLRAATHGRGVYEFDLGRPQRKIELYVRDHILDLGRHPAATGEPDPTAPGTFVQPGQSPDIRLDIPQSDGSYQYMPASPEHNAQPPAAIDLYTFTAKLSEANVVPTHSYSNLVSHVYVQVHNRGILVANNVRVMLLLATQEQEDALPEAIPEPLPLPPLPTDYERFVRTGLPIAAEQWQTIGSTTLHGIRAGYPQIAHFVLEANQLPTPGRLSAKQRFALVAIVHAADDPFTAAAAGALTPSLNRHVAHKMITLVPFTGAVPVGTARRTRRAAATDELLAEHRVRAGETLSYIAKHYYHSAQLWPAIYRANRRLIGPDPHDLQRDWILKIPRL